MKPTHIIAMPIFGVKTNDEGKMIMHHVSILNYGTVKSDKITYITKDGEVSRTLSELKDDGMVVFQWNDVDLNHLIENKTEKPVVIDESLEIGLIKESRTSRAVEFLVKEEENNIRIKPIYN